MIEISNLTKKIDNKIIIDNFSLTVATGEKIGLVGDSGVGKTALLDMVVGYTSYADGGVKTVGSIGYLPQKTAVYEDMTVGEFLAFMCELKNSKADRGANVSDAINSVSILGLKHKIIKSLSSFDIKRVSLAAMLICNPTIFVMDEPISGLSKNEATQMLDLIKSISVDKTVLISALNESDIDGLCDEIVVLNPVETVEKVEEIDELVENFETEEFLEEENLEDVSKMEGEE